MFRRGVLAEAFGTRQPLQLWHELQLHCPKKVRQMSLGCRPTGPRNDCLTTINRYRRRPVLCSEAANWRGGTLQHTPLVENANDAERLKELEKHQLVQPHASRVDPARIAAANTSSDMGTTAAANTPSDMDTTAPSSVASSAPTLPQSSRDHSPSLLNSTTSGESAASTSRSAIVIGSNAAACTAAMYLCRQGWHVTVACGTPCSDNRTAAAACKFLWLAPRGVNPLLEVRTYIYE